MSIMERFHCTMYVILHTHSYSYVHIRKLVRYVRMCMHHEEQVVDIKEGTSLINYCVCVCV